ncbi:MAG: glycosyltransferase [Proteobacteria bacterium]|nr:glycosyltransferase [Pseudomonadota bacterium]
MRGISDLQPRLAVQAATGAKRILICSAGIPHERDGASVVLFYHYIDRLRLDGYRIHHILLLPGQDWPQGAIDDYAAKMADPADLSQFSVTAVRASRFYTETRRLHRLISSATTEVETAANAFGPDIIVAFDLLAAWITARVEAPHRLVWLGDLNFQTILYHAWYSARENPLKSLHIPSNWLGARSWKRVYHDALKSVDQVIVASASSVEQLANIGIQATYEPYPWPEITRDRSTGEAPDLPGIPTFVFFGSLGGLGSRSALHFITKKVFPILRRQWGEGSFRILVAGRGEIPDWARRAFDDQKEIERLGFVDDLDALLAACHAVLVPIDVPVGNRSRILTAMAKRVLIIAHANAALGNPDLEDGSTCYLASNAGDFVKRMRLAVEERATADTIIDRAYRRYGEHFSIDAAGGRMARHVQRIIDRNSPCKPNASRVS